MPKTPPPQFAPSETPEAYSIALHCTTKGSDKIYKLSIAPSDGGWVVNYANGPRLGTIKPGTHTGTPLGYDEARSICTTKLVEKLKGGYLPIEGSRLKGSMVAEAIETVEAKSSGVDCQLLVPINEDEVETFMTDDRYVAQRKHNGERRPAILTGGSATGSNRLGQTVALPKSIRASLENHATDVTLDGEEVGDTLHAFDILSLDGRDLRGLPYDGRLAILNDLYIAGAVRIVETARTTSEKRALLAAVRAENQEGIVFKLRSAVYEAGAKGKVALKFKLWNSLSAIVSATKAGRRSVSIHVLADDGSPIPIGNVTIPSNHAIPEVGSVIEVRYLFARHGGSLEQPVYEGLRTDILPSACHENQRRYEGGKGPVASTGDVAGGPLALAS